MLAIVLPEARAAAIRAALEANPGATMSIDLVAQAVTGPDGQVDRFEIDPFRKECLLAGLDEIDLTLRHEDAISAHERRQRDEMPWLAAP